MYYRRLGSTGLWVSEISFGTIPILQGDVPVLPSYFDLDEDAALAVMEHAYRLGCNLYDTAIVPEYGDAENQTRKFAARVGRERIIISDKARFFGGGEMYRAVETSCENLGTTPDSILCASGGCRPRGGSVRQGRGAGCARRIEGGGKDPLCRDRDTLL